MSDDEQNGERPAKRQRRSSASSDTREAPGAQGVATETGSNPSENIIADPKEVGVGITEFVSKDTAPFRAVLKTRYTDFLVNEILPDGEVVRLINTTVPEKLQISRPGRDKRGKRTEGQAKNENGDLNHSAAAAAANEKSLATGISEQLPKDKNENELPTLTQGEIADDDRAKLVSYLNEKAVGELLDLYQSILRHPTRKAKDHPVVRTEFTNDRSLRADIHGAIRRIFSSKIESNTDKDGFLCLAAANLASRRNVKQNVEGEPTYYPGKLGWLERGGEYLHFTLCKENKDTMEAVSFLCRQLRLPSRTFQFAGTKDRRAVTSQRCSAHRLDAERLANQNYHLRNAAVGDFEYKPGSLELGDLGGNEFVITLRQCEFTEMPELSMDERLAKIQSALELALRNLHTKGFLNYYGLQRFGTFATRTDTTGLHILKNDYRAACDSILHYDSETLALAETQADLEHPTANTAGPHIGPSRDEILRAKAIQLFHKTDNLHNSLELLPRKFTAESNIVRHLARTPTDYVGALLTIPRNLRLMYVHAYQSLVWNNAATNRWQLYGSAVTEGDLVLVNEHKDKQAGPQLSEAELNGVDADGEVIILPPAHDSSTSIDDMFERARPLTAEEAASGKYTVFDIVLPLPGYDILYPANASGAFYKTFMAGEDGGGLDPYDMRRKQKDFSLSGSYRKLFAGIGPVFDVSVHAYARGDEQFVKTDLERAGLGRGKDLPRASEDAEMRDVSSAAADDAAAEEEKSAEVEVKDKVAAVLKFQLGASQYATMALRELSRGGVAPYQADANVAK